MISGYYLGPTTNQMIPVIYLAYWRVKKGVLPGIGKMLGYAYTLHDNTFGVNWEIVEEE